MGRLVAFLIVALMGIIALVAVWVIVFPVLEIGWHGDPYHFVLFTTITVAIVASLVIATIGIVHAIFKPTDYGKSKSDIERERLHDHGVRSPCQP
jgi:magnesium-transporting ATPase (P-type)